MQLDTIFDLASLTKPVRPAELLDAIASALAEPQSRWWNLARFHKPCREMVFRAVT